MARKMLEGMTVVSLRSGGMHESRLRVTDKNGKEFTTIRKGGSDAWTCTCKPFLKWLRNGELNKECEHIHASTIYQDSKRIKPMKKQDTKPQGPVHGVLACTGCSSTAKTKAGMNKGKQMYKCKACGRRYRDITPGFERAKYSPQIISSALNMVMSGMSYRKAAEHIASFQGHRISQSTILGWVTKYSKVIKEYVDALKVAVGDTWSVDEALLNVKRCGPMNGMKHAAWLWTSIDPNTRLVLATIVSADLRNMAGTSRILKETKEFVGEKNWPRYLVTDSLGSYPPVVGKQLPRTAHVQTKSIRDGFTNMSIERYHNEIREKLKSCRGLGHAASAQVFADLLRIHHNFIRPHMGLGNKTPAEEAGLTTPAVRKGKYKALISMSAPRTLASKLGALGELVEITASDDAVRVEPKSWLDADEWTEINDILMQEGFTWLFSRHCRHWVKSANAPPVLVEMVRPAVRLRRSPV